MGNSVTNTHSKREAVETDHYNITLPCYEYYGYGSSPRKALKNLLRRLKYDNLLRYNCRRRCESHNCEHILVFSIHQMNLHMSITNVKTVYGRAPSESLENNTMCESYRPKLSAWTKMIPSEFRIIKYE